MKVWQGIGTAVLSLIIAACLVVSAAYNVLDRSVLDSSRTKAALKQSRFYGQVRDDKLLPSIQQEITQSAELGGPLTQTDIIDSLHQAFPEDQVRAMTDTALDATYSWLNKKSPSIDFSIDITTQKQTFLDALTTRVDANLKNLPVCRSFLQVTSSLADVTCLSPYVTQAVYRDEIMQQVRDQAAQTDSSITAATVGLDDGSLGSAKNIPDYISYLWALNLITLPIAGLLTVYLIIKRRGSGLLAVSIVLLVVAVACLVAGLLVGSATIPGEEIVRSFADAVLPIVRDQLRLLAIIGGAGGIVLGVGGIMWLNAVKRRQSDHFTADDREE